MKKFTVTTFARQVRTNGLNNEEVRTLTSSDLANLWAKDAEHDPDENANETFEFDTKAEAETKANELVNENISRYYWGNSLLDIVRVTVDENEVDEDGDFVETIDSTDYFAEVN